MRAVLEFALKKEDDKRRIIYFVLTVSLILIFSVRFYNYWWGDLGFSKIQSINEFLVFMSTIGFIKLLIIVYMSYFIVIRLFELIILFLCYKYTSKMRCFIIENLNEEELSKARRDILNDKESVPAKWFFDFDLVYVKDNELMAGNGYFKLVEGLEDLKSENDEDASMNLINAYYPIAISILVLIISIGASIGGQLDCGWLVISILVCVGVIIFSSVVYFIGYIFKNHHGFIVRFLKSIHENAKID